MSNLNDENQLTPVERQTLLLLHKVLSHLDEGEADYHQKMVRVLTEGFTIEYENVFTDYPEVSKADCRLVHDILNMFRVMKSSLRELDEAERDALLADHPHKLTFGGFDFSDDREGKMGSYVVFLMESNRWTDLGDDVEAADGGNSHAPMLGRYQKMLDVYEPRLEEKRRPAGPTMLDAADLRQVAES